MRGKRNYYSTKFATRHGRMKKDKAMFVADTFYGYVHLKTIKPDNLDGRRVTQSCTNVEEALMIPFLV